MRSAAPGFGILEVMLGLFLVGSFAFLANKALKVQVETKKIAQSKSTLSLQHTQAVNALSRYQALGYVESYIQTTPGLSDCFQGIGVNCENFENPTTVIFRNAATLPYEANLSRVLNGFYTVDGEPALNGAACTPLNCPVRVTSTQTFECDATSCAHVRFLIRTDFEEGVMRSSEDKVLLGAIASLNTESTYFRTKQVGLTRSFASTCDTPTGLNLDTGTELCGVVQPSNSNLIFNPDMGFSFQNTDLRLAGNTSCPNGTTAEMKDGNIVCTEPPLFCTNAGAEVREGRCCSPSIPGNGDGWGAWGACSERCEGTPGVQTRPCAYPKEEYCNSVCSRGELDSRPCTGAPNVKNGGWSDWTTCTSGTQSRSCTQPRGDFCGSTCDAGQTESRECCPAGQVKSPSRNQCVSVGWIATADWYAGTTGAAVYCGASPSSNGSYKQSLRVYRSAPGWAQLRLLRQGNQDCSVSGLSASVPCKNNKCDCYVQCQYYDDGR